MGLAPKLEKLERTVRQTDRHRGIGMHKGNFNSVKCIVKYDRIRESIKTTSKQASKQTRSYVPQENIALLGDFNPVCMCPAESRHPGKRKKKKKKNTQKWHKLSVRYFKEKCNILNLQDFHISVKGIDMLLWKMPEIVLKYRGYEDMAFWTQKHFSTLYCF